MPKNTLLSIFFLFLIISGCKSIFISNEPEAIPNVSLNSLSIPKNKISNNIKNISESQLQNEIENLITQKEKNIGNYYQNYLDSLKLQLQDSGSVQIKNYEGFLVDLLSENTKNDTIYLANIATETNSKGIPLTFQYDALINDDIFFEIECLRLNALSNLVYGGVDIEFIEGSEVRFQESDLRKNKKIKGSFKVLSDNPIVLNINKKGFIKATVKIKLKKVLGNNFVVEKRKDSIEQKDIVIREITDTLYHIIDDRQYVLSAQLDFSKAHKLKIPIIVNELENIIGWGFWIGLNHDISNYKNLSKVTFDDPLKLFAKTELVKTASRFHLPKTPNEYLAVNFSNYTNDALSLNSTETYSFFKSDSISKPSKGKFDIVNLSKIYDFNLAVKIIAVNTEKIKIEVEETTYKMNEYINISKLK